jgi:hypothetical protein
MKPKSRAPEQDDLLRPRLTDMIDLRHELVKLTALIDWEFFEEEWAGFFPSHTGRPANSPRLVAGQLYLQHAYQLSDEAVVARWVENPYHQHLCGETFFQHRPPVDPSSLTRWRNRIGEEGVEWLLTKTIEAGREAGVISERSAETVVVDTTSVIATPLPQPFPLPRTGRSRGSRPASMSATTAATSRRISARWCAGTVFSSRCRPCADRISRAFLFAFRRRAFSRSAVSSTRSFSAFVSLTPGMAIPMSPVSLLLSLGTRA